MCTVLYVCVCVCVCVLYSCVCVCIHVCVQSTYCICVLGVGALGSVYVGIQNYKHFELGSSGGRYDLSRLSVPLEGDLNRGHLFLG
jgi:hypothetical protein